MRPDAGVVGTACSRLPVPNPHFAAPWVCVPVGYAGALAAVTFAWLLLGKLSCAACFAHCRIGAVVASVGTHSWMTP